MLSDTPNEVELMEVLGIERHKDASRPGLTQVLFTSIHGGKSNRE